MVDSVRCMCMRRAPGVEVLIDERQIANKLMELGREITSRYDSLLLLGVLTGAYPTTTNLAFALFEAGMHPDQVEVDFIGVSSHGSSQTSSREPLITKDTKKPIAGKNVLLTEDIVDSGYSIKTLLQMLNARGAASLAVFSLLSKPSRREVDVQIDYVGFKIPNKYVVGYGLDNGDEQYRILPYIGFISESE